MRRFGGCITAAVFLGALASAGLAQGPAASRPAIIADFTPEAVSETVADSRKIVRYEHEMLKEWGYPAGAPKQPFIVVEPAVTTDHPPLIVVLHGAGAKATGTVPAQMAGFGPEFLVLDLDCADPKGSEGWYGWFHAASDRAKYANTYAPPEHRLLALIEWVTRKHHVDRNRIYMFGNSMGGSGALGLGMARGDIFAAIFVRVPAGVDHAWFRMGFPELKADPVSSRAATGPAVGPTSRMVRSDDYLRRISGVALPDAPPIIDFSSQLDSWATNQENLIQACRDGRHSLIFSWGTFGHAARYPLLHPVAMAFPWLSIRKDEAYPVFTGATTDQTYPGQNSKEGHQQGQINAYFRWKAVMDEPAKFQMELRLVDAKGIAATQPISAPETSTADVTPRRLQKFKVQAGKSYAWRVTEGEKVLQSGKAKPDEVGLLTIPRVTIVTAPRVLMIEPEK